MPLSPAKRAFYNSAATSRPLSVRSTRRATVGRFIFRIAFWDRQPSLLSFALLGCEWQHVKAVEEAAFVVAAAKNVGMVAKDGGRMSCGEREVRT